jgi:hypothetical protein
MICAADIARRKNLRKIIENRFKYVWHTKVCINMASGLLPLTTEWKQGMKAYHIALS